MDSVDHQTLGVGNRNADAQGLVPRVSTEAHTGSRPWRRESLPPMPSQASALEDIRPSPVLSSMRVIDKVAMDDPGHELEKRMGRLALAAAAVTVALLVLPTIARLRARSSSAAASRT